MILAYIHKVIKYFRITIKVLMKMGLIAQQSASSQPKASRSVSMVMW